MGLKAILDSARMSAIAVALVECGHHRERTAQSLEIGLRTLHYWLKAYGWKQPQDVRDFLDLD